jgi:hypothetical protein
MPQLDATTVGERLGLGDDHRVWLAGLEAIGPPAPSPVLPNPSNVFLLFERLGIIGADAADLTRSWPSPDRTPELLWLLERCHRCIVADWAEPRSWHRGPPFHGTSVRLAGSSMPMSSWPRSPTSAVGIGSATSPTMSPGLPLPTWAATCP